ncbi:PREDICTED: tektin-3-like [Priapulus caudatus]|uniref:Tektin n=1 Tax=Priapulus caudatus TaxID=37621 RepID=A0ABM1EUD0_PRICU|nr:PREDICTED: tektin-3-like [Priapulus caudatus]
MRSREHGAAFNDYRSGQANIVLQRAHELPWRPSTYRYGGDATRRRLEEQKYQQVRLAPRVSSSSSLKLQPLLMNTRQVMLARSTPAEWLNASLSIAAQAVGHANSAQKLRFETMVTRDQRFVRLQEKEVNLAKECKEKMTIALDRIDAQMRLNRDSLQSLEFDTTDKQMALSLDELSYKLSNTSRGICFHPGVEQTRTDSDPQTWMQHSDSNIQHSQAERTKSAQLRKDLEAMWTMCINDMWSQFNKVNTSISERQREYEDARSRTQHNLSRVMTEMFDMEKNIDLLSKSIRDLQAPLQVAQTRLHTRAARPNVELCHDPPHQRLVYEIAEIQATVRELGNKLQDAEAAYQRLQEMKDCLQRDLEVKNNSVFVDREKCLGIRKAFPICHARLVAY